MDTYSRAVPYPYLSLDRVPEHTRDAFVTAMAASLRRFLDGPSRR